MLTYQAALDQFNSDIRPAVLKQYSETDIVAMREAWNDYTDSLSRERDGFNALQYHHCPAVDDTFPDDDIDSDLEYILDAMGVTFSATPAARSDGLMLDMPEGTKHYLVTIGTRYRSFETFYSQGPAITGSPQLLDVLQSLLSDASGADQSFEEWCRDLGYDDDSRKALRIYQACEEIARELDKMFSKQEIEDLNKLFSER